jgi:magnesium chelatase subunit H
MKSNASKPLNVIVLYVGTSLPAPLRKAEAEINKQYNLGLRVAAHNCGAPLSSDQWQTIQSEIHEAELIFLIHVTDSENANRIAIELDKPGVKPAAVIAFNCMPDLMRRTRMGKLDFAKMMRSRASESGSEARDGTGLVRKLASWMADYVRSRRRNGSEGSGQVRSGPGRAASYVGLISRLPTVLKFVPTTGRVRDIKHYLTLFAYFLQPTPKNIRSMLLYAINSYAPAHDLKIRVAHPESMPAIGVYHPDAERIFDTFKDYRAWYERSRGRELDPGRTIGLLLMRPQIVSDSSRHYDGLIRAIEAEGLAVIPAISTLMDNREACVKYFVEKLEVSSRVKRPKRGLEVSATAKPLALRSRVNQILSLTGFSFVGGPAMNDSQSALEFLRDLNVPFRSMVSLDLQTIEDWETSRLGLNPIQTAMQIAIPEIDGATEALIYGGMPRTGYQPEPIEERCRRIGRRLARWTRLRSLPRSQVRLAFIIFCFPPNKGNIGTAADLDVFHSLFEILTRLSKEGYSIELPGSVDALRDSILTGNANELGQVANVAYLMSVDEYRKLCPYVDEIEREWGRAPGAINSNGREVLILGVQLGNVFVGVQPTFGYEGDPMRLLAAEGGAPHHGFAGLYTYLERVFQADAVVHVGTHGATEFMPGKQAGLSSSCWPDRLIGELPNIYIYSVNNPSEGTIAKRRSYAELISYLTPPIENAGLYKELASMKELIAAYRKAASERERDQLFEAIEEKAGSLNL